MLKIMQGESGSRAKTSVPWLPHVHKPRSSAVKVWHSHGRANHPIPGEVHCQTPAPEVDEASKILGSAIGIFHLLVMLGNDISKATWLRRRRLFNLSICQTWKRLWTKLESKVYKWLSEDVFFFFWTVAVTSWHPMASYGKFVLRYTCAVLLYVAV